MVGLRDEKIEKLKAFVAWSQQFITGDEKGQAQIFLDRLFQACGQPGCLDVGGTAEFRIRKATEDGGGTSFADYVWKPVVLIEMKKRGADLSKHFRQAFDYWTRLVPGRPRYVILCNFDEFWIYDFESQMDSPVDKLALVDLPDRFGPLGFLFKHPERPVFGNDHEAVTREAADLLAGCFQKLIRRKDVERDTARRFILQMLVALFSEDIGLLDKYTVVRLLEDCKKPQDSYDLLGGLFVEMNTPGVTKGGRYKGVDYFNGGLFREPARIELHSDELNQLKAAATKDWSQVQPEIFGTIFEHSMEEKERHAFGAHFTSPVDIMKIVGPTIVEPWRQLIEEAKSIKRLRELLTRLQHIQVLDPACGSGNFLYIAYREMKRLEARIFERMQQLSSKDEVQTMISFVTAEQFHGIDINPFAVELAKVTMMIARKLAIDELHVNEHALPLGNLDLNFIVTDALIDADGKRTQWPKADIIIGNPPFLDARKMTIEYGERYVTRIEAAYPEIARRSDLCVYWLRKAHDHLAPCTAEDPVAGRAGLVGTQNIRNNEAREGGLDYIVQSGTIVEAVESQPWSGEAAVNVSIVDWVKREVSSQRLTAREQSVQEAQLLIPEKKRLWSKVEVNPLKQKLRKKGGKPGSKDYELGQRPVSFINSALSDRTDVSSARILECSRNPKCVFEGVQTGHVGFVLNAGEARALIAQDRRHSAFIKPFINGSDLLSGKYLTAPEYVVDLSTLDMLEASALPLLLEIPRQRVLPTWEANAKQEAANTGRTTGEHQGRIEYWWALKRPRQDLQDAIKALPRYIACSAVMKRNVFVFLSNTYLPTNAIKVFAFADDYSFGVLQSGTHWMWFVTKCSKLTERFRYTPESVFDTFPWPQSPTDQQIRAVAAAGREIRRVRDEALAKIKGGLRALYRTLELPGKNPLKDAHAALDAAVLDAYGFDAKKDLLAQLLELNLTVAARIDAGEPVTAPGVPASYPTPADLVSEDCIRFPG